MRNDIPGIVSASHTLCIDVAGVRLKVASAVDFRKFRDFRFYREFVAASGLPAHCSLDHWNGPAPDLICDGPSFVADNWKLARAKGRHILSVGPGSADGVSDNVAVFNKDFTSGVMYQQKIAELFSRFIDQFLVINLLSRHKGFLLHASGLVWEGKGICFAGPSGAGKSTLLDLFKKEVPAAALLNDDRLALKRGGRQWRVFGTPWYGESRVSSSMSAGLAALFFIRHSRRNYIRRSSIHRIVPKLAVLGLMPLWDRDATSRVLAAFQDLIHAVPVYELGFIPDKRVVGLIKKTVNP